MTMALSITKAKLGFFQLFFSHATAVEMETMEILMDLEQTGHLLAGLDEARRGQLVACGDAFADL
jgi:hypothetical protein